VAAQKARNKLLDVGRWARLGCGVEARRFAAWIAAVTRPRLFDRGAVAALRAFARAAAEEGGSSRHRGKLCCVALVVAGGAWSRPSAAAQAFADCDGLVGVAHCAEQ
jgi:hypothetical protein